MKIKKTTNKPIILGCIYNNPNNNAKSGRGAVYDINGIAPTIITMVGGGNKPCVVVKKKILTK